MLKWREASYDRFKCEKTGEFFCFSRERYIRAQHLQMCVEIEIRYHLRHNLLSLGSCFREGLVVMLLPWKIWNNLISSMELHHDPCCTESTYNGILSINARAKFGLGGVSYRG